MESFGSAVGLVLKVVAGIAVLAVVALPLMAVVAAIYGAVRKALGKDEGARPPCPPTR